MARFLVGILILANAHLITAMAGDKDQYFIAEAPMAAGKLGKHDENIAASRSSSSPSESPKSKENAEYLTEASVSGVVDVASSVLKNNHHHDDNHDHHRWIDEPSVGGVVILGGLVAAFLVTVFWYIRVTRRRNAEQPSSPTNVSIFIPKKERS